MKTLLRFDVRPAGDAFVLHLEDDAGQAADYAVSVDTLDALIDAADALLEDDGALQEDDGQTYQKPWG